MRLLLVEDDEPLATGLTASLRLGGYNVDWFARARDADGAVLVAEYDAIVLDLNLPDLDGLELLRGWRRRGMHTPVLILSARDDIEDRVAGLDIGADDYLTKPFDLLELEARLRVLIRRGKVGQSDNRVEIGALVLDLQARRAWLDGQDMQLTLKEFMLLQALALKSGQVQAKEQLMQRLSDFDQDMSANALDILIHRLRKKLDGSSLSVRTLRGFGYLLENAA